MRNCPNLRANRYRVRNGPLPSSDADGNNGAFVVPVPVAGRLSLRVIVSDQGGWDHVSVSLPHRCPSWEEMCMVKDLFFRDDETVVQYHPAKEDYVNYHPNALHLWRPQGEQVPRPPAWMVGPRDGQTFADVQAEANAAWETEGGAAAGGEGVEDGN